MSYRKLQIWCYDENDNRFRSFYECFILWGEIIVFLFTLFAPRAVHKYYSYTHQHSIWILRNFSKTYSGFKSVKSS